MIKRIANIFLILVVVLLAVQPRFILHFCGDKFVAFYINHDPSLIKNACESGNFCEKKAHCPLNSVAQSNTCAKRNLITFDIDTDDFSVFTANSVSLLSNDMMYSLPNSEQNLFAQPAVHLFYSKSPPFNFSLHSGRDILTHNCVFLI